MVFPGVRWCSRVRAGVTAPCPHNSHWEHLLIHHILDKSLSVEMSVEMSAEMSAAWHQSARDAKRMVLKLASRARRTESSTHSDHDARKKAQIPASRAGRGKHAAQPELDARKTTRKLASRAQGDIARVKAHRQIHMVNST